MRQFPADSKCPIRMLENSKMMRFGMIDAKGNVGRMSVSKPYSTFGIRQPKVCNSPAVKGES